MVLSIFGTRCRPSICTLSPRRCPWASHNSTEEIQLRTSERHRPASQRSPGQAEDGRRPSGPRAPRRPGGRPGRSPGPSTTVGHQVRLRCPRAPGSPVWPASAPELLGTTLKPDAPLAESRAPLEEEARRPRTRKGAGPGPGQRGTGAAQAWQPPCDGTWRGPRPGGSPGPWA